MKRTNDSKRNSLQRLYWQDVRSRVEKVKPDLAKIIDEISPDKQHPLYIAKYTYGANILKRGDLYLPNQNGSLTQIKKHDSKIAEDLGYNLNSNPVSLILKNSVELFLQLPDRAIPFYGLIKEGTLFGAWRVVSIPISHHPIFLWDMTAGARSIFMLPKITQEGAHNRLKKNLHIDAEKPKLLLDHWAVFKEIANNHKIEGPWSTEMIFFSKKWFEHHDDKHWLPFNYHMLEQGWIGSDYWRSEFIWDLVLSIIQKRLNLKPNPHIATTTKYLLAIAAGATPGFIPATDNTAAPIDLIQDTYMEEYGLKKYTPTVMHLGMFDMYRKLKPVYYSLQLPIALEFSQKSSDNSTIISDLYAVRSLMNKYLREIKHGKFNIETTPLFDLTEKVKFDYFHSDTSEYFQLQDNKNIAMEDGRFICKRFKENTKIPTTSSFLRGCVRVSNVKKQNT